MDHWDSFVNHGGPYRYKLDEVSCEMFNPHINKSAGLSSEGQYCQNISENVFLISWTRFNINWFRCFWLRNQWTTIWLSLHSFTEMSVDRYRNVERINLPSLEATTAAISSNLGSVWPLIKWFYTWSGQYETALLTISEKRYYSIYLHTGITEYIKRHRLIVYRSEVVSWDLDGDRLL